MTEAESVSIASHSKECDSAPSLRSLSHLQTLSLGASSQCLPFPGITRRLLERLPRLFRALSGSESVEPQNSASLSDHEGCCPDPTQSLSGVGEWWMLVLCRVVFTSSEEPPSSPSSQLMTVVK